MCTLVPFYFIFYHKKIVETVKLGLKIRPVLMKCVLVVGEGRGTLSNSVIKDFLSFETSFFLFFFFRITEVHTNLFKYDYLPQ